MGAIANPPYDGGDDMVAGSHVTASVSINAKESEKMGAIPKPSRDDGDEDPNLRPQGEPELPPRPANGEAKYDPFSADALAAHRIDQDFASLAGGPTKPQTIDVKKPPKQQFVRTREGDEWVFETCVLQDEQSGDQYLVIPQLWESLSSEIRPVRLYLTITHGGLIPFLWPVKVDSPGRTNSWNDSARAAAERAMSTWVRVISDTDAGEYKCREAQTSYGQPLWPTDLAMRDYLELAFRERVIVDLSHPVVRRLRGQI